MHFLPFYRLYTRIYSHNMIIRTDAPLAANFGSITLNEL
jgi:hypothetical protein